MAIEDDFDTGDWMGEPWFTKGNPWREEFEALGLPLEERERLVPVLARVFDKTHCIAAHARSGNDELLRVPDLFGIPCNPSSVAPRLWLAANLLTVGAEGDTSFLRRLRLTDSHDETVFELAVFANLMRAGFSPIRIPEHKSEPRADLLIHHRDHRYEVEVKRTNQPDLTRMATRLTAELRPDTLTVPGVRLTLLGSQYLDDLVLDEPHKFLSMLPKVGREFRAAAALLKPGTEVRVSVEKFGEIVAELASRSSVTDSILPDLRDSKKTSRIVRNIRKAASQFSPSSPGIVVVALAHFADAFDVEREIVRLARDDQHLLRCRMVVLCDAVYQRCGNVLAPVPVVHMFSPKTFRRLSKHELEIAHVIASNPVARARQMPRSMRLATDRPRSSVVQLGTIELKSPGDAATITIRGSDLEAQPLPRRRDAG